MELKIRIFPDPVLREKSVSVEEFDGELKELATGMVDVMHRYCGVGLAAPQVGILKRVIAIDLFSDQPQNRSPMILVNPVVTAREGEIVWNEGCLSFPGIYQEIKRSEKVRVKAQNVEGDEIVVEGEGLLSVALQHEIDHLDGVLIYDYMSFLKRKLVKSEMKKKRRQLGKDYELGREL